MIQWTATCYGVRLIWSMMIGPSRATTDRQSNYNGSGRSQVGGRNGGMNDAPLTNKVRVAPSPHPALSRLLPAYL